VTALPDRRRRQQAVQAFLQKHFGCGQWEFTLPHGRGGETYFASQGGQAYFVKRGVDTRRYQIVAALGLTPPVLAAGHLPDGASILVQPRIPGRNPSRQDYRAHLDRFAAIIAQTHRSPALRQALPAAPSEQYRAAGMAALTRLRQRWEAIRPHVPPAAALVDQGLARLAQRIDGFQGEGLAASHNDICNANWLLAANGQLYLIDLESMALDDPALDIGATLWWYYPPDLRQRFVEITGQAEQAGFEERMQVRMALHCLSITLPRPESFDGFDPATYTQALTDFRAILSGEENPQGYD